MTPLNHLKVITVTVNPTPPKPAGSKLLNSTSFYLNTRYTHTLSVQLQNQHFNGWWSVQYIFSTKTMSRALPTLWFRIQKCMKQCTTSVLHSDASHTVCCELTVLWIHLSNKRFSFWISISIKNFILNINQYQEKNTITKQYNFSQPLDQKYSTPFSFMWYSNPAMPMSKIRSSISVL